MTMIITLDVFVGSRSLLGVEDLNVFPIRGQTVIVNAPHVKECVSELAGKLISSAFLSS